MLGLYGELTDVHRWGRATLGEGNGLVVPRWLHGCGARMQVMQRTRHPEEEISRYTGLKKYRFERPLVTQPMESYRRASWAHCSASAPAGMRRGVAGSVAARQTASATSFGRVPRPVDACIR